jgi:gamma-D-glutamyl-L-lysine dipeptidyl-peptidase
MLTVENFGVCNLSVAPVRAAASDQSEIVTQLLFGDFVRIIEKGEPWIRIRFEKDNYEGWMDFKQLHYLTEEQYEAGIHTRHLVLSEPILELDGPKGIQNLMLGSNLPFLKDGKMKIGNETYIVLSPVDFTASPDLFEIAEIYINTPYLWGGKSIFGIDCSGLVQNVFKVCGVDLPRDASQQVGAGTEIPFDQRQPGDVVFFVNDKGIVHHCGILTGPEEVIHASGRVRRDKVDGKGLFNTDLEKYTHTLHSVRRFK